MNDYMSVGEDEDEDADPDEEDDDEGGDEQVSD
jgi:hypothetical protein